MSLEPPSCPCPGLLGGASGAQGTWSPHTQHVQQLGVGAARPSLPVPPPLEKPYQRSACGRGWGTCHGSRAAMSGKSRDGTHWKIAQPVKDVPWVQVPRWGSQRPDAADASCTAARPGPPPGTLCPLLPRKDQLCRDWSRTPDAASALASCVSPSTVATAHHPDLDLVAADRGPGSHAPPALSGKHTLS